MDFKINISFDKEKIDQAVEDIKIKYCYKPLNEDVKNSIKKELKQKVFDATNIEFTR